MFCTSFYSEWCNWGYAICNNRTGVIVILHQFVHLPNFNRTRFAGVQISKRYMRGCIDRFLLFNMGTQLRREMAAVGPSELCRVINRQMMHLVNPDDQRPADAPRPAVDRQKDMIEVCSCLSDRCNGSPAHGRSNYQTNHVTLAFMASVTYISVSLLPLLITMHTYLVLHM